MAVYSSDANQADFFGEGTAAPSQAPALTLDQIAEQEAARRKREQQAALANVPYGTPVSRGGSAQGYQVTTAPYDGPKTTTFAANPNDPAAVLAAQNKNNNRVGAGGTNADSVLGSVRGDFNGTGGEFIPSVGIHSQGQSQLALDQGKGLADQALAGQPTVQQGHAVDPANIARLTPVIDPMLESDKYTDAALAMSKDLVDRVLNTPLQTKIAGDQALSNQLATARSARGGAGAQQDALNNAQNMAPQLLQQTDQASIQEQTARAGAAGQAASIFAGVAGGVADREVKIKEANQGAGLHVMDNLTTLTGQDLQFDANQINQIGLMARDFNAMGTAFAGMDVQLQVAQWDDLTKRYGIDKNFDAQIKAIAAQKSIGPLDALKMVLGGAAAVGGLAVGGPAGAAVAGAGVGAMGK